MYDKYRKELKSTCPCLRGRGLIQNSRPLPASPKERRSAKQPNASSPNPLRGRGLIQNSHLSGPLQRRGGMQNSRQGEYKHADDTDNTDDISRNTMTSTEGNHLFSVNSEVSVRKCIKICEQSLDSIYVFCFFLRAAGKRTLLRIRR